MSHQGDFDEESTRRAYGRPYTAKHPVPTIQGYREHRAELKEIEQANGNDPDAQDEATDSRVRRAYESVKTIAKDEDNPQTGHDPYPTANRNLADRPKKSESDKDELKNGAANGDSVSESKDNKDNASSQNKEGKSATEAAASHVDPKQKRKDMKKIERTGGGREVTDPVTHLPIVIQDRTTKDLQSAPENKPPAGSHGRTATGLSAKSKSEDQLEEERIELQRAHNGMQMLFPPPNFDDTRNEIARTYRLAMTVGLGAVTGMMLVGLTALSLINGFPFSSLVSGEKKSGLRKSLPLVASISIITLIGGLGYGTVVAVSGWLANKVKDIWDDETWDSSRQREVEIDEAEAELPESVTWLNSLLASIWPMINPDLFASLSDMLEDVMQASLPRMVRMVSVEDLGQGSEAVRILGVRWLPTGAASQSVDEKGNLKKRDANSHSDRTDSAEGELDNDDDSGDVNEKPKAKKESEEQRAQRKQEQQAIREGMEAEEGDFVNMELAFAYRARSSGKSLKTKAKNAHLYLKFYLPGGIAIPIWVEVRGLIGIMRLRLQLTPDPPFFSLCTLTFLGQPRADLSCVPLSRHSLNIMDVPLISSFVQSAIDAALAEYVAPKSLTLDLKDMLVGDDFKKDTVARGVVLLFIKRARGFKEGDGGIGPLKGSSDSYVTVSWGKFGKPVASTRVIEDSQEPEWHEWSSILVTPDELNAEEKLRVQLWDSDKMTADDDLGRIEVDLKYLMYNSQTKNRMQDREDQFKGEDPEEEMPGTLTWSVGYFAKTRIQEKQLEQQKVHPEIRTKEALKEFVSKQAEHKLREATALKDETSELHQQKVQDYKEEEDAMIISTPPLKDHPSGIFSIQIHNIVGLDVAKLNKEVKGDGHEDREEDADQAENLPDSYATIILNHRKIYRTRTKPKNAKPFFNAGTERFVKDWTTAEVMVSVRDSREKENDPLMGVVYLPLRKVFEKSSQVNAVYPLAGGIGYGKARISMVWRSTELALPKEQLGWEYGTLEVKAPVKTKQMTSEMAEIKECRIRLRTNLDKVKMTPVGTHTFRSNEESAGHGEWQPKKKKENDSCFLAVRKRYSTPLVVEWRKSSLGFDSSPAFAVYWLGDMPDEEEKTVTLKVWKGGKENMKRAETCYEYHGIEEGERPLGEIEVTLKFWRGLSGYHKRYAQKARNDDVRNVMEVLDTVSDEKMGEDEEADVASSGSSSSSGSDSDFENSDSSSEVEGRPRKPRSPEAETKRKLRAKADEDPSDIESGDEGGLSKLQKPVNSIKEKVGNLLTGDDGSKDDGSRDVRGQLKDYKDHHKQLHRQHRGVMQWKTARTLDWMVGKVRRGKGRAEEVFEHGDKDQGIETEV